jgi:hypothetical protein
MDTYAISKLCGERVGRGFARRFTDVDIYALRIGNVIEPHEYERDFPKYISDPKCRKRNAWSYIDAYVTPGYEVPAKKVEVPPEWHFARLY